ncbi:MAG TPA: hypothetical protein VGA07_09495 [Anaerolineales bacterium]
MRASAPGFAIRTTAGRAPRSSTAPRSSSAGRDLALKFARPLTEELESMREGAALAGFLHLAAAREDKLQRIAEKQLTALAYELVQEDSGERPIMAPLSQIGGRMAVQIAARLLQNDHGGRGILLGGLAGVPPAEVAVLGAGVAGSTSAGPDPGPEHRPGWLHRDLPPHRSRQPHLPGGGGAALPAGEARPGGAQRAVLRRGDEPGGARGDHQ